MTARLVYLVALVLIVAIDAQARAADQTLRLAVGQSASVELEENPSTGYRWTVDAKASSKASSGLPVVRITDRGFSKRDGGKGLVGTPGIHRWDIQAVGVGSASVVFIYRRPWEGKHVRSYEVAVEAAAR